MNKAQEAYIREHFGKKSVKELVEDTEAKLSEVKKFIKTLNVTAAPKELPKTFFHTEGDKIVAMTAAQSAVDDEKQYMKNTEKPKLKGVFIMDPNKPVR